MDQNVIKMARIEKAIILAAGMGQRMGELTKANPKCLTDVNGIPILENALRHLEKNGIIETIIVVGHLKEKIIERFGDKFKIMHLEYIESKKYDQTNNMYSLWLAREKLKEGVILIEGDCFFEEGVLIKSIEMPLSNWVIDSFKEYNEGCMLVSDEQSRIKDLQIIRHQLTDIKSNMHKSVGILKIRPELGQNLAAWLDEEVQKGNTNIYYDLVLQKHLKEFPIYICNISSLKWVEIDDTKDLKKAEELFSS